MNLEEYNKLDSYTKLGEGVVDSDEIEEFAGDGKPVRWVAYKGADGFWQMRAHYATQNSHRVIIAGLSVSELTAWRLLGCEKELISFYRC